MSSGPTPGLVPATALLNSSEAAALSGLSTDTIKNDRSAGRCHGARQDPPQGGEPGTWRIPAADLVAADRLSPARRALERSIDILETTLGLLRRTSPSRAA